MNIWLNPKYSKTMGVHAGKPLSRLDMGKLQRLSLRWEYMVSEKILNSLKFI